MTITRLVLIFMLLSGPALVLAQDQAGDEEDPPAAESEQAADPAAPPPIPPIPPKITTDEEIEPSVVIRRQEDKLVEEYSINGRVYMVKITPDKGLPYYYLDEDGDGMLELQPGDEAMNPVRPAYWKVKEWK